MRAQSDAQRKKILSQSGICFREMTATTRGECWGYHQDTMYNQKEILPHFVRH